MNHFYELIPKYQRLATLCRAHSIPLDMERGQCVLFQGHVYLVLFEKNNSLTLVNEWVHPSASQDEVVVVDNWDRRSDLVCLLGIEGMLELIRSFTSIFPAMTPGVETGREVWQVRHPGCDPVVAGKLEEALVDLCIQLMEQETIQS